jgi:ParB/RepB/Spo0J family partition protein
MDASDQPTTRSAVMRHMLQDMPVALDAAEIPVDKIVPNPHQPRDLLSRPFDPEHNEDDASLVASIKEHGVIQPIGVTALPDGTYQLLYGERRWRASVAAGKTRIPAVIKDRDGKLGDAQQSALALIENLQRSDLLPWDVARALEELQVLTGYTWVHIAQLVGKSERSIRDYRLYNDLDEKTRRIVQEAGWGLRQVAALANAPVGAQYDLAQRAVELGLTAPAIQKAARQLCEQPEITVEMATRQAAGAHKPRRAKPRLQASPSQASEAPPEEVGAMTSFHEHVITILLTSPPDASPQEKREATLRAKSLRDQVTGYKLDVVDTRHAALLMRRNKTIPAPAAVGMAKSLRGTRVGKSISHIETGLDMLGIGGAQPLVIDLTENQREAMRAISDYLQQVLHDLDKTLAKR